MPSRIHTLTSTRRRTHGQAFPGQGRALGGDGFYKRAWKGAKAVAPFIAAAGQAYFAPKSKIKSSIKSGRVINEGTGGQCSYYTGPRHKCYLPKHVENALPPIVEQSNFSLQLTAAVGKQNVANVLNLMPPSIATTYTADKITRVLYEKATADVTINNAMIGNAYLIIYDIALRKDSSSSSSGDPFQAWSQGITDEGSSAGVGLTYLGSTPFQSELFNQFMEVKQTTKVVLCGGGTHVHHVRLNPNRLVSAAYAQYTNIGIAGLTQFCMIEVHGPPANDKTTQTQVSSGKAVLNVLVDYEVTLKQLAKATPSVTYTNTLVSPFTVGEQVVALGGTTVVDEAEG